MSDERPAAQDRLRVDESGSIQIGTARDAIDFATWCFESGYLPGHIKNVKQAFAIMQRGAEMGLPPFASWRFIYQTKGGKLALESKGALAVCQSKPTFEDYQERIEGEGEGMRGVAVAAKRGMKPTIKEFTFQDAKAAGLTRRPRTREGKEYDGPWQAYLKDMLLSKARERALSIAFAAELGGIPIEGVAEEIEARQAQRGETVRDLKTQIRRVEAGQEPKALPPGKPRETLVDLIRGKDYVPEEPAPQPAAPPREERRAHGHNPEGVQYGYTEEVVKQAGETADPIEQVISSQIDEALGPPDAAPEPKEPAAVACQGCGTMYHASRAGCPECGVPQGEGPPPPAATPRASSSSPFARALRDKARRKMATDDGGQGQMFDGGEGE